MTLYWAPAVKIITAAIVGIPQREGLLRILMYHRVLDTPDPLLPETINAKQLNTQLKVLASNYAVLPLVDAVGLLGEGKLPHNAVCITFDDGYRDNYNFAFPILRSLRIPATIFVASGFLDGGIMFNDSIVESVRNLQPGNYAVGAVNKVYFSISNDRSRSQAVNQLTDAIKYLSLEERDEFCSILRDVTNTKLRTDLMMTSEQVRDLSKAGIEIGGHTVTHPILTKISINQAAEEIKRDKATLEGICDKKLLSFAYPNGKPDHDYKMEHVELIKAAGYRVGVSTGYGVASAASDFLQLPRFVATEEHRWTFMYRMQRILKYKRDVRAG